MDGLEYMGRIMREHRRGFLLRTRDDVQHANDEEAQSSRDEFLLFHQRSSRTPLLLCKVKIRRVVTARVQEHDRSMLVLVRFASTRDCKVDASTDWRKKNVSSFVVLHTSTIRRRQSGCQRRSCRERTDWARRSSE